MKYMDEVRRTQDKKHIEGIIRQSTLTIGELYNFLINHERDDKLEYEYLIGKDMDDGLRVNNIPISQIRYILEVFAEEYSYKTYDIVQLNNAIGVYLNTYNKLIKVAEFKYDERKGLLTKKEANAKAKKLINDLNIKNRQDLRHYDKCIKVNKDEECDLL